MTHVMIFNVIYLPMIIFFCFLWFCCLLVELFHWFLFASPLHAAFFSPTIHVLNYNNPFFCCSYFSDHAFNQANYHVVEDESPERRNSLALVPWTPPQVSIRSDWVAAEPERTRIFEVPMDADETEVTSMDVEETPEAVSGGFNGENLGQWLHCVTPPSLPNPSAHVMWSR